MKRFVALQDFFSPETESAYCAGFTYRVRAGDAVLDARLEEWERGGRIARLADSVSLSEINAKE